MKISLNWLADYVELPASDDDLASKLTMAGLEVEGIERLGEGLDGVIVGQILEINPHPNAERLSVTKVDTGSDALQVVCGAKNFKVGDKVPLATVGTKLPGGPTIEKAKLRGVESFGMLCSARELNISEDASGLLILPSSLANGTPIAQALGLKDVVFEINVTPNRSDCLSHIGVAREVAALTGKPVRLPDITLAEDEVAAKDLVQVRIDDLERCPRYAARVLLNTQIAPSPMWMQNRLRAVGVRALSNAVDVTNYVLLECGQPLHAFDLDLVEGAQIVVRRANQDEKMTTLDGKERQLSSEDLCICDLRRPSALAGVMGGAISEVSANTRRILLESAYFQPSGIRRTARRHGLHSEASYRFERGVDPQGVLFAQDRAAKLLAEMCGAKVARGRVDVMGELALPVTFPLRHSRVGELLGVAVPGESTKRILGSLGFTVRAIDENTSHIEVPSWRVDVEGEADCVEEVARIQGYANIPSAMPRGAVELAAEPKAQTVESRIRVALASAGFDEVVNYSFVSANDLAVLTPGQKPIALKNPLAADQAVMCTTRIAGLLGNLRHNRNRQVSDVRLYEIGRVYLPVIPPQPSIPAYEPCCVAGVIYGRRVPTQWAQTSNPVDFYDLKGAIEQILESIGAKQCVFQPDSSLKMLHPRSACSLKAADGANLGFLGELHPQVAQQLDLPRDVFVFELNLDALVQAATLKPAYRGVARFPAMLRDLAIVLDEKIPSASVEQAIRQAGGQLVEEVVLFDVFRGASIPSGKKSLAYAIRYRAAERTLTDDEANGAHERIIAALARELSARLRT